MSRVLLITGTDTGVGKTIATAALAVAASRGGPGQPTGTARVAIVKPAQTGVAAAEPGDLAEIHRLTGLTDLHEGVRLREPLAPTTAARREGVPIPSVEAHARTIDALAATRDLVLVEGAGGLLVGLDEPGHTLADLATHLTTPAAFVVVTRSGLGTLNHTALTAEALQARSLPVAGYVIGSWPAEPDLADRCNLTDLPSVSGWRELGRIPADAATLRPDEFSAAALTWCEVPNL